MSAPIVAKYGSPTPMSSPVSQLVAGRDLDALVAEKVMGFKWFKSAENKNTRLLLPADGMTAKKIPLWTLTDDGDHINAVPKYSTDIGDAERVVEKLRSDGFGVRMTQAIEEDRWNVEMWNAHGVSVDGWQPTLPHAICEAALAAVGEATE